MAHRVNMVLDDDVWQCLQAIPGGERSRFINKVLSLELLRRQQREAWDGIQDLRRVLPVTEGHSEECVREEREVRP